MEDITGREIVILKCLREKLNERGAELLENVISRTLATNGIQRVCEIINDEYLMKGIEEDYSPNEYGRDLENLLNKVNAPRLS
jgi:uncharacterized protein YydD (DUF2326 family)